MESQTKFLNETYYDNVTIPNGTDTSNALDLGDHTLCGVEVPDSMTGTSLSFIVSIDGISYVPLKKTDGNLVTITINSSASMSAINPNDVSPARFVKIKSNANETGDKEIRLISIRIAETEC